MPAFQRLCTFYRYAFLRHAPRRYALMLPPAEAERLGQKYDERRGIITPPLLCRHLAGEVALAAPAAVDGQAYVLPLDIDAGGCAALLALIAAAQQRELRAFGQYCPRPGWEKSQQRGYVWLPFDQLAGKERLQQLGAQLIAEVAQPTWRIEPRAIHAVTRLPLARHMHTGCFGDLLLDGQHINIDNDPPAALAALCEAYRENTIAALPAPPPQSPRPAPRPKRQRAAEGITIASFNQDTDVEALIRAYGARPSRRRGLYFCPFHPDDHASLHIYSAGGRRYAHCLSKQSDCPLARHGRNDAFNVYCIGEQLDVKDALRRLNNRE
jgi:hypothetical protein